MESWLAALCFALILVDAVYSPKQWSNGARELAWPTRWVLKRFGPKAAQRSIIAGSVLVVIVLFAASPTLLAVYCGMRLELFVLQVASYGYQTKNRRSE